MTGQQPPVHGARVEVVGLGASYGRTRVLDSVRFTVGPGGWLAVIGPNGSGKSTLLRSVLGLQRHEDAGIRVLPYGDRALLAEVDGLAEVAALRAAAAVRRAVSSVISERKSG